MMPEVTMVRDSAQPSAGRDLIAGLRSVGVGEGDIVIVQLSRAAIALAGADADPTRAAAFVLEHLRCAIGTRGTLVVPTYTFSFCRGEPFDPAVTPAVSGP